MPPKRNVERLSGVLLFLMLVTSVLGAAFAGAVGTDYNVPASEVPQVLRLVAENRNLHQLEIGFDLASFVFLIALSGAFFVLFSPLSKLLAVLGTLGLLVGGVILAVHDVFWFVFPSISQEYVVASGPKADALLEMGRVYMLTANWGLSVGIAFMGLGILAYGMLMVKSGSVPRILGWLGVIAGILLFSGTWLPRIDESLYTLWTLLSSPVLLWEIGLGFWLLKHGISPEEEIAR